MRQIRAPTGSSNSSPSDLFHEPGSNTASTIISWNVQQRIPVFCGRRTPVPNWATLNSLTRSVTTMNAPQQVYTNAKMKSYFPSSFIRIRELDHEWKQKSVIMNYCSYPYKPRFVQKVHQKSCNTKKMSSTVILMFYSAMAQMIQFSYMNQ